MGMFETAAMPNYPTRTIGLDNIINLCPSSKRDRRFEIPNRI